jgi:hypothetical protein
MGSWIDKLETHGRKAAKEKQPARPKAKVERVICTIRPSDPETGDPGSARFGYYTVDGELLTMTDENGTPIKTERGDLVTAVLENGSDAGAIRRCSCATGAAGVACVVLRKVR